jgi:hypothetical protein
MAISHRTTQTNSRARGDSERHDVRHDEEVQDSASAKAEQHVEGEKGERVHSPAAWCRNATRTAIEEASDSVEQTERTLERIDDSPSSSAADRSAVSKRSPPERTWLGSTAAADDDAAVKMVVDHRRSRAKLRE